MAQSLVFTYGAPKPIDGMHLVTQAVPTCGPEQVVVEFLAAPVNPLDFLVIHGKYPIKPQSTIMGQDGEQRAVPGSDGAARIVQVGSAVSNLAVDDLVILRTHCKGTWRTHAVFGEDDLIRIPSTVKPHLASILRMGIAPAYFLLREYHGLEPGDWIIQNAATGTISHFVSQLAPLYGIRVISVIRNRSTADELERTKRSLRSHGASLVLTEDELRSTDALAGKRIVLAIDSVSDDSLARNMAASLTAGGTLVTAGFLGTAESQEGNLRQFLWQRNITLKSFRLSDCLGRRAPPQQVALFEWFADLLARGTLKAPALEYVTWKRGAESLEKPLCDSIQRAHDGAIGGRKTVLVFE
ncbi:hypothetical protein N7530_005163 [Penicillium desertorum]|jgi:trans-2-enoyl-CoA reductase|uniref:enoyl-[acyl-carrier-protein] reductase n=1 Tax=Penicillium desertorum TaxID=1303715 RepID=A0A9W9WZM8_9EURO|nr:hypothetical protein N7530_005163 [Penicillium desertorum]